MNILSGPYPVLCRVNDTVPQRDILALTSLFINEKRLTVPSIEKQKVPESTTDVDWGVKSPGIVFVCDWEIFVDDVC